MSIENPFEELPVENMPERGDQNATKHIEKGKPSTGGDDQDDDKKLSKKEFEDIKKITGEEEAKELAGARKELNADFAPKEGREQQKPNQNENQNDNGKTISRRGFLGNVLKTVAGIAIGSSVLGRGAEAMAGEKEENETKEEKEAREARGLIKDLYNLPDSPLAETEGQKRHMKMQVADRKIRVFALQRKLGFTNARKIEGTVIPKDMQETMGVLGENLEYMIDSKFNYERKKDKTSSDQELKEKIKEEIYSHPGIMKLRSLMETYSN
jgi:hypothetical protein